jgi:hypothetical protein
MDDVNWQTEIKQIVEKTIRNARSRGSWLGLKKDGKPRFRMKEALLL